MRLTPIAPADLTPEQRPLYDDMREGIAKTFKGFVAIRDDGALLDQAVAVDDGPPHVEAEATLSDCCASLSTALNRLHVGRLFFVTENLLGSLKIARRATQSSARSSA